MDIQLFLPVPDERRDLRRGEYPLACQPNTDKHLRLAPTWLPPGFGL
jgi:hypothetical protein